MTTPTPTPNSMPGAQQQEANPQLQQPVSTGTPPAPSAPAQGQPASTPPASQPPAPTPPATDEKKPETDWKSHARTWEQRAKENEEKARKWEEEQAAKRTKEEQQAVELQEARERAEKAEQAVIRERIARETGVLPDFLVGGNEEEMRANAQRLMEWRAAQGNPQSPPPPQTAAVSASTVTNGAVPIGTSPNGVPQLTKEQFVVLPPAERMAAVRAGQCENLGVGKPKEQRRMGNEIETGAHGR